MNCTGRLALVPALILLTSGAAFGQLTDVVKKAANADNAAIARYVDAAVKNLVVDDPDKQARGRDDLIKGVVLDEPGGQLSVVYLDAYAGAVAKALVPLTTHEDMRVRLNAAIANARIAERAGNTRLSDVTVRFINDKTLAVSLWGVKAARSMLPAALAAGGSNNPLLAAIFQAVQRFGYGPIVSEVYDALSLNIIPANPKPAPAVVKGAVPEILRVFRVRIDSYGGGVPPDPTIDNIASEFLSFGPVWQQMPNPQKIEAVQAMIDLLSYVAQHSQFIEGEDRQTLIPVFKRTGAALQVIGDASKNPPVSASARQVSQVTTATDGSEVVQRAGALSAALQKAFPGVKPSPQLPPPPPEVEVPAAPPGAAPTDSPPSGAAPATDGKAPAPPGASPVPPAR